MQNENPQLPTNYQQPTVQEPDLLAPLTPQVVSQPIITSEPNFLVLDRRVSAFFLDIILWLPLFIIASQHFGTYSVRSGMIYFNLTGVPFAIFSLVFTAYYVLFEWLAGGSLGKLAVGIRVKDEQQNNPSFGKSLVRNVLRVVDGFPYIIPNLAGFIVASTSDKKQRLGDKVAHTVVVKTDNAKSTSRLAWLSLAVVVVISILVIIFVPAAKTATGSTHSDSTTTKSSSSAKSAAAQSVSDQIFNDSINGNAEAVYALASPELKKVQTEAQIAAGLQQLKQLIVSKPLLTSQASYPTSNEARFVYTVQTTQGAKQFILDLGLTDGQWLLYSAQLRK